jgi:hypothetical protein
MFRKYESESTPLERSEFNWLQWQFLRIKAFFGFIPTHKTN